MLNVRHYLAIRIAHQKNESERSIARRLRHFQETVASAIASESGVPPGYKRTTAITHPKLGSFIARIDAILLADESATVFQGELMTAAFLDRFTHRCTIIELNGESYRFRESTGTSLKRTVGKERTMKRSEKPVE